MFVDSGVFPSISGILGSGHCEEGVLPVKPFLEVRNGKVVVRPTLHMGKLRLSVTEAAIWPWQQRAPVTCEGVLA